MSVRESERDGSPGVERDDRLKVGELARRTGLTVRTLRHYDEIELLRPASRTRSGHRLYGSDEVRRLQQICSLRQLGFSLEEVRQCLDRRGLSLREVIELHIRSLDEQMDVQRRLRWRLELLREHLRSRDVPISEIIETIEVTTMMEKYYTADQLEYLERRRRQVGEERIHEVESEWMDLFARFAAALEEGVDAESEPVLELARKAKNLIEEFTGGDAGIERALGNMYREKPDTYARWGVEPAVAQYMGEALAALRAGPAS